MLTLEQKQKLTLLFDTCSVREAAFQVGVPTDLVFEFFQELKSLAE